MSPTRFLVSAASGVALCIVTSGTAAAVPGHTSCKDFGAATADAAHAGLLVPEIRDLTPGLVDDVLAFVQVGDETVPPLCIPK